MVHDVWLHSVGVWPAAQCQAASPTALVPTCQTPIVAVVVEVKKKGLQEEREKEKVSPWQDLKNCQLQADPTFINKIWNQPKLEDPTTADRHVGCVGGGRVLHSINQLFLDA